MWQLSIIFASMLLIHHSTASIQDFIIESEEDLKRFGDHNSEDGDFHITDGDACGNDMDDFSYAGDVSMANENGMSVEMLQHLMKELMKNPQYAEMMGKSYNEMNEYSSCQPHSYMDDMAIDYYQD